MPCVKARTFVTHDRGQEAGGRPIGSVQRGGGAESAEEPLRTPQGAG